MQEPVSNPVPDSGAQKAVSPSDAARALRKRRRRLTRHAVVAARSALEALGQAGRLDRRTWQAQLIRRIEGELTQALGGPDVVSPQQQMLVASVARTQVILTAIDAYIADERGLGHPVNRHRRALWPVILQRQQLADGVLRHLQALGLERRARPVPTLQEYLAARAASAPAPAVDDPREGQSQ